MSSSPRATENRREAYRLRLRLAELLRDLREETDRSERLKKASVRVCRHARHTTAPVELAPRRR
jgi:hypothetical protein